MGGHAAGEVASEMAVQIVQRELSHVRDLDGEDVVQLVANSLQEGEPRDPRAHAHRSRQAGDGDDGVGARARRARATSSARSATRASTCCATERSRS